MSSRYKLIEQTLQMALEPAHLEVIDESNQHADKGGESHFKVVIVSAHFAELSLIARHRQVNQLLADILDQVHALSIHTLTPAEWQAKGHSVAPSPPCANRR